MIHMIRYNTRIDHFTLLFRTLKCLSMICLTLGSLHRYIASYPLSFFTRPSALPSSSSKVTTSPLLALAARCNGVLPSWFWRSILNPFSVSPNFRRACKVSTDDFTTAMCKGVLPLRSPMSRRGLQILASRSAIWRVVVLRPMRRRSPFFLRCFPAIIA